MEVYLNVAETGIGTYGVEAGAQRYFRHGAARLTPSEAARIAAILPLPKKREAISPSGFTRRYGNTIRARIGVVGRDGLEDRKSNTSELQSLMRTSYAVFCLKKKKINQTTDIINNT